MRITTKIFFIIAFFLQLIGLSEVKAQKPIITDISKSSATVNEVISITGSGFGTTLSNIRVNFGSVNGQVISVTANLVKAKVPAGVTYDRIAVTNISSGLTGYSSKQFGLSFGGDDFSASNLGTQQNFTAGNGIFDLCLCDFDGDGKSDVATSNEVATDIGLYRNVTTGTNINLSNRISLNLGVPSPTKNINCGDIDGDGKPDLVISGVGEDYGKTIFILRNISSVPGIITFAPPITQVVGSNGAARINIRDLNADGKPELIVTNRSVNLVSVFPNTSTVGAISFSAVQTIAVTGAIHTNGLATEDLDNDGLPELIVNTSQQNNIYIFKNQSTSSSISFQSSPITLISPLGLVNLAVGDLDNDGLPDIAATSIVYSSVYLFRNITSSTIAFGDIEEAKTDLKPWGITLGDADGDGSTDIIVACSQSNFLNVLENNSTPGVFSFTKNSIAISEKSRNVKLGDMNGDAKPDLVFISSETFNLSVIKNNHCVQAKVSPAGPLAVCSDTQVILSAPSGLGISYEWFLDGISIFGQTNSWIEAVQGGTYTVSITSTDGCSSTSAGVDLTIDSAEMGTVTASANSVCAGGTITLTGTPGGTKYIWSGPNGFSRETTTNTTTIPNATTANNGQYSLVMEKGLCSSLPITFNATVNALPNPIITPITGTLSFCEGGSVELSAGAGFSDYKWKKNGSFITSAVSSTLVASEDGNYSVVVANANGCSKESAAVTVSENDPPVASFVTEAKSCLGQEIAFENTSQVTGTASYLWDFGDGTTSTQENPAHIYSGINNYTVTLEVSYNADCKSTATKSIEVIEAPVLEITVEGNTTFCAGDSVKLSVPATFKNYVWTAGSGSSITSPSIYAKKDGIVTVAVITNEGCTINASIELNVLENPEITIDSDKMVLKPGESAQLFAIGGNTYTWTEADGLTTLDVNNPMVTPTRTTTYMVTGTNNIGCSGTAEITIEVDNELSVTPPKLFVPESDLTWQIEQMEYYSDCSVIIFNKQGLKLYEQKDYSNNAWNGTYNNQNVPEGVYYFVIRCEGNTNDKTGSITLMR